MPGKPLHPRDFRQVRCPAYHNPISFHQAKPTVDQMARFTSETAKPTRNQQPNET